MGRLKAISVDALQGIQGAELNVFCGVRHIPRRFVKGGIVLVGSEDEDELQKKNVEAISLNKEIKIDHLTIGESIADFKIHFSNDLLFEVFVTSSDSSDEQWALYMPDRKVFSVYGNGRYSLEV